MKYLFALIFLATHSYANESLKNLEEVASKYDEPIRCIAEPYDHIPKASPEAIEKYGDKMAIDLGGYTRVTGDSIVTGLIINNEKEYEELLKDETQFMISKLRSAKTTFEQFKEIEKTKPPHFVRYDFRLESRNGGVYVIIQKTKSLYGTSTRSSIDSDDIFTEDVELNKVYKLNELSLVCISLEKPRKKPSKKAAVNDSERSAIKSIKDFETYQGKNPTKASRQ